MASIIQDIEIKGSIEDIFEAVTTQKGIEGWWTTTAKVNDDDAEYRFENGNMSVKFRYDRKDADHIALTCVGNENNPEWQDTKMAFELEKNGNGTKLHFVHDDWKKEGTDVYNSCVGGWEYFLASLKAYVETGSGTPHDKPKLK